MDRVLLHLQDNHPCDTTQVDKITEESTKDILRYLSSHPLQSIKNDKGSNLLVFPHSFKETKDEIRDMAILHLAEKDGEPESISTGNLVGFIGYKHVDIHIHSRFSSINEQTGTNDYFLYYMLSKVMNINLFNLDTSSSREDSIFDFLLFFFPQLLKEALAQGMYKKYVYHEYNDANIRGVININRHIRLNIPANGHITYRTREFCYDNPMTQLIRHTIEFIRRKPLGKAVLHNDAETETCVQQIIQATPTFVSQQRQTVINENLRPIVHPYFTKYAALQQLCLRILRHEKISYGQANDQIHGLLIDAAWLWEEYIARILSEHTTFRHYTRSNSFHLLQKANGQAFQSVIPDYMDDSDKEHVWVADAKYIPLHQHDHLDADRAAAVYYKTIMYMYRFNSNKGFLFHPIPQEEMCDDSDYTIIDTAGQLLEVGLTIPSDEVDYPCFSDRMKEQEQEFVNKIKNKVGG